MLTVKCKIRCFSFHRHLKIPLSSISCPFIPFVISTRRNFHFLLSFILPVRTFSILLTVVYVFLGSTGLRRE